MVNVLFKINPKLYRLILMYGYIVGLIILFFNVFLFIFNVMKMDIISAVFATFNFAYVIQIPMGGFLTIDYIYPLLIIEQLAFVSWIAMIVCIPREVVVTVTPLETSSEPRTDGVCSATTQCGENISEEPSAEREGER